MADLLRLARLAATGAKIHTHAQRAQRGDLDALGYLLGDAPYEAIDAYRPGAGDVARSAVGYAFEAWQMLRGQDNVIDGEYRVLPSVPWADMLVHIPAIKFGAIIIVGPIGGGKTKTAIRLAEILRERTGYDPEVVAGYRTDYPDWIKPISMKTVFARAQLLSRYLDDQGISDEDKAVMIKLGMLKSPKKRKNEDGEEEDVPDAPKITAADLKVAQRKITIIEESSVSMGSMSSIGKLKARDAAQILAMHCRHEEFRGIVIYLGQLLKQIAPPLRTNSLLVFKEPTGEEQDFDDPNDTAVKRLWREATAAFEANRQSPYCSQYPRKSWCYLRSPTLGGHGWAGMMPINLPGYEAAFDGEYEEES